MRGILSGDMVRWGRVLFCMGVLVGGILGTSTGCWVDRRSDALRCGTQGNCPDGRSCEMGWCVVTTGPVIESDAMAAFDAVPASDAMPDGCPDACTACSDDLCIIECDGIGSCGQPVVCPPDTACEVRCGGPASCVSGVVCDSATECTVTCSNVGACAGPVLCGDGPCSVTCSGMESCAGGIDCSESCACETACSGVAACEGELSCPDDCARNGECRTTGTGCNDC